MCFPQLSSSLSVEGLAAAVRLSEGFDLLTASHFRDAGNHFRLGLGRLELPVALEALERMLP